MLLTRDDFRHQVFTRDNFECVVCRAPAQDAHHIMERRLWPDGGYYLENGASVCGTCHLRAEQTLITVEEIRRWAGVKRLDPPHLYSDVVYDKWGNVLLENGKRVPGELFYDESVQRVIPSAIKALFVERVKYPRTHHLPWSPSVASDDRVMESLAGFEGEEVVVTEKMDGENTTMYPDYIHARSVESANHPSRSWVKGLHASIAHDIPSAYRICGENLYARHSIGYEDLPSYFLVFGVWERDLCLSWEETLFVADALGLQTVPEVWRGQWDAREVRSVADFLFEHEGCEGYVVRPTRALTLREFPRVVGKAVRRDHVQTRHNWMQQQVVPNGLG